MGVFLQLQRDIVSSNLPLYAYTSNSVLIGPMLHFDVAPFATTLDTASDTTPLQVKPDTLGGWTTHEAEFRLEGGVGGTFGSNDAKGALTQGSVTADTNNVPLEGNGLAGSVALWADGPLVKWTGNPAFSNVSLGLEYRHFDNSEAANVNATVLPSGLIAGGNVPGTLSGNFESENLMFNAAWRLNSGDIHPFIGVGGGVAFLDWSIRFNAPGLTLLSASNPSSLSAEILAPAAAGHTFAGLDYDVTPRFYVGAGADFYFTDTITKQSNHTSIQLNANQFSLMAHAGYRF
jgi:hypothetical protein